MPTARTALHGREACVAQIERALDALVDGKARGRRRSPLIVIEGVAGIGKTRLVEHAITGADDRLATTFVGRAEEVSRDRPFGPLLDAFGVFADETEPRRESIAALLRSKAAGAGLYELAAPEVRTQVIAAFAGLVAGEARTAPVLLVVEDLHWADMPTALTLRAICRSADVSALVIVTTRPSVSDEHALVLQTVVDEDTTERLDLGPLDDAAAHRLAEEAAGGRLGPRLTPLVDGARGSPLLILTLVDGLCREDRLRHVDGCADVDSDELPRPLALEAQRLVSMLSPNARRAVRMAAVLGSAFTTTDLVDASGLSALDIADALEEAMRAGLIVDEGDALAFRHHLVREAIYGELPAATRGAIHRELGRSLAARDAPASTVAAHLSLGAEVGDEMAVSWIRRAARQALDSGAPASALGLLDRALPLARRGTTARGDVLADRVEALGFAGRLEEAEAASTEAIRQLDDPERIHAIERLRALALLLRNRTAEAADILERLASTAGSGAEGCRAEAALAALGAGDLARAERLARGVAEPSSDDAAAMSLALTVMARIASLDGRFEEMLATSRRAVDVADHAVGRLGHRHLPLLFHAMAMFDAGRWDDCHRAIAEGRHLADDQGVAFAAPLHDALSAFVHLRAGDVDRCASEAASGVTACDETGMDVALVWNLALAGLAALHQNDVGGAALLLGRARAIADLSPPWLGLDLLVLGEARLIESTAGPDAALERLIPAFDLLSAIGAMTMAMTIGDDLVRIAVASARDDDAQRAAAGIEQAAACGGLPAWRAAALHARGLVDADADLLREAVVAYRGCGRPLDLARAIEHLAERTSRDEAVALLTECVELYDTAGATRDRLRASSAMRILGARVSRTSAGSAWAGLSPAEVDVARLVAEGLSNQDIAARLFVGRRTVETHLRRVYAKLGLSSRVELALWVVHRSPTGT